MLGGNAISSARTQASRVEAKMRGAQHVAVLTLVLLVLTPAAQAHSWYPKECCDDHDCVPADGMTKDARGHWQVSVGRKRIWVPQGFQMRPSKDHRIHICYRVDETNFPMPFCLFVPAQS